MSPSSIDIAGLHLLATTARGRAPAACRTRHETWQADASNKAIVARGGIVESIWFGVHERVDVCEHRGAFLRSRVLCSCVLLCGMWPCAVNLDMIVVDCRSGRSITLT